jgi:hypothetical protein
MEGRLGVERHRAARAPGAAEQAEQVWSRDRAASV